MPRGEETQEVPQEGKDQSEEIRKQDLESQRDQEAVSEPEAVIERERDIKESEAIEEALSTAVEEAADLSSAPIIPSEGGVSTLRQL